MNREKKKQYITIDLKSFYASVECMERGLDPLKTLLVVADESRTEKTICLAVSPSLKSYGIPGRARLFEVVQKVRDVNLRRKREAPGGCFTGKSSDADALLGDPSLEVSFIAAPPRMAIYMECSSRIYSIYLRYFAPEDMHVYSVDEVFIDATSYLRTYGLTARELAKKLIREVEEETGITATAGIGTNLYLSKIAMDVWAKKTEADADGVRIAELDEESYKRNLWTHEPLTDFWRVGPGTARKFREYGIFTMGDIARASITDEDLLYRLFGVNAELLIDHAWGIEPCTMADIKAYKPESNSLSSGQVLKTPYSFEAARVVVREMTDALVMQLVDRGLETDQIVLDLSYDTENVTEDPENPALKRGITKDRYGRKVPKHAHGTANLPAYMASSRRIVEAVTALYDRISDPALTVRFINVSACRVLPEGMGEQTGPVYEQLDLFTDYEARERERAEEKEALLREKKAQQAILSIQKKYGKNAVLKGMNFEEGATGRDRNREIGGHRA